MISAFLIVVGFVLVFSSSLLVVNVCKSCKNQNEKEEAARVLFGYLLGLMGCAGVGLIASGAWMVFS